MNFKTTLILLVLLAAVGSVMLFTRDSGDAKPAETITKNKLITIASAEIQKISIAPNGGAKIVLARDGAAQNGAQWKLLEPVAGPADASSVNSLLTELTSLQSQTQTDITPGTGLQSPRIVVELIDAGGKTTKLNIGERSGVGDRLYVQLAGNAKADIVAVGVDEALDKSVNDFRDKRLVTLNRDEIHHLVVQSTEGKLELVKEGENWKVISPQPMPADSSAVSDLLSDVTGLRAEEFVAGAPASSSYGLNADAQRVTIAKTAPTTTQPTTQPGSAAGVVTLLFGRPDSVLEKNLYATVDGSNVVVKVSKDSTAFLNRKPIELRDKKVLDLEPNSVSKLSVTISRPAATQPTTQAAENRTLAVTRRPPPATQPTTPATTQASTQPATRPAPTKWMTADGENANDASIDAILKALHPLKATKFVDAVPAGAKVTLQLESGGGVWVFAQTTIEIVDSGKDKSPVASYNGLHFEIERSLLDQLEADFSKPGLPPAAPASFEPPADFGPQMP